MELKLTPRKYRIMAAIVDIIINLCIIFLILALTSSIEIFSVIIHDASIGASTIINLISAGLIIEVYLTVYLVLIPLYNHGATFGQRMFHMSIVKEDGSDVDFETLFIRQIVGNTLILFSTFAIGWVVSLMIMLYRKDNACLADIIGRTYVIDRK